MDKNEGKIDKSLKALMACEIINAITGIFIYVIAGFLKKYNIEKIYRVGILIKCIFVISIVFLREQIQSFLIPIAIILGISETIYWGACDNIVGLATNEKNREKYTANKKIIRSFVKVIMPIILGTSIELLSFYKVSTYIMVLAFIQFILSFFIKIQKRYSGEFDLKAFLKSINLKENKRLKIVYKSSILYGVLMNVISTIVTIIIVMTYKTNIELGFLSTIFSICSMITLYVFKKIKNEKMILIDDLKDLLPKIKSETKGNIYSMVCFDMTEIIKNLIKEDENGNH